MPDLDNLNLIKALEDELNLSFEERNFLEQRSKLFVKFQNKLGSNLGFIKGLLVKKVQNEEKVFKMVKKLIELQALVNDLDLEDLK